MRGFVSIRCSTVWTYMMIFILWLNLAYISTEGSVASGGTCFDEPLIHPCKGLYRLGKTIKDVEWKTRDAKSVQWNRFAYCNGFLTCMVEQAMLPNGVKVTKISNGTVTLQTSAKAMTDGITELICVVHYSDSTMNTPLRVVKIHYSNFTVCIRAQRASDVNFTKVLQNILPWQQVVDIEFYDANKTKLAYCHASNCTKEAIESSHAVPVFWNRLQVKHGSLLLTRIEESDDERENRVKVHLNDYSVRFFTLKILVPVNGSPGTEIASLTTATVTPAATSTAILTRPARIPIVKVTTTPTQTESSRIHPSWQPKTPTTGSIHGLSSASTVLAQEWTAILSAVVVFLGIVVRDL